MAAPWWSADVDADSISRTQAFMKASIQEQKPFYINLWLHMSHDTIDPRPEWYNTTVREAILPALQSRRVGPHHGGSSSRLPPPQFPFQETCLFPATQAGETICPGQVRCATGWGLLQPPWLPVSAADVALPRSTTGHRPTRMGGLAGSSTTLTTSASETTPCTPALSLVVLRSL